jgi:tRNA (adenine22-N1)-methyltransferase
MTIWNDTIEPIKLSRRLRTVAERIPQGSRLADIGSDHAMLPVFALQQGLATAGIAGEVVAGPLEAAKRQIREAGLEDRISARLGDGLDVIEPGEASVITICGMGGCTLQSILERGADRLSGVERLILQPNVGEAAVRKWMLRHNWLLIDETIVEEEGLFYEVLTAVPIQSDEQALVGEMLYSSEVIGGRRIEQDLLLLMGPHLIRNPQPELQAKWNEEIRKRTYIMEQMGKSESIEAARKLARMREETESIKEVLACLQMDKR